MRRRFRTKEDWLIDNIRKGRILYLGSVDPEPGNFEKHRRMQRFLEDRFAGILGVYYSDEQVATLRREGLSAVVANVERLEIQDTFDCIIASDNLEHLTNCGAFLDGINRHLADGGCALVSTPNPASLVRVLELILLGKTKANTEHTCWFTGQVLDQLAQRFGLRITSSAHIDEMRKYHRFGGLGSNRSLIKRLSSLPLVALNSLVCFVLPQFSETFGFVLESAEGHRA